MFYINAKKMRPYQFKSIQIVSFRLLKIQSKHRTRFWACFMQIKKQCKYDETSKRLNICLYISKTLFKGFLDACRHRNTNNTFSSNERKLPIKLAYLICISMLNLSVDLSLYLIKMCVCCNVSTKYNAYQKLPFITTNVMLQVSISFEILRIVVIFVIMFPMQNYR